MKNVTIHSKKFVYLLAGIALLLIMASIAGQFTVYILDHPRALGIPPLFYLEDESNIPTYFSSFLLGLAAFLLGLIALSEKNEENQSRKYWIFLAVLFLFFSIDEAISLHERLNRPVFHLFDWDEVTGWKQFFFFTWVVPGIVFTLGLIVSYLRFFLRLPKKIKVTFSIAALLCFLGVIGMEMISSYYMLQHGSLNFAYSMIVTVEETLELSGIILFIHGLFDYINEKGLAIQFKK